MGEHVDAACLRQQHRVSRGGVGDGTQTVRMGGFHERPDRELVEAGRIDDDLDVVDALGDALGDVGPRLAGIGDQGRARPIRLACMLAGWVAPVPLERTSVTPGRPRSDATSSGGQVPMSSPVVTP